MPQPIRFSLLAALAIALSVGPALAETLCCRSVNGNTTCAGSGAVSCQTINGRTTCVSGGGGVVQRFGGPPAPAPSTTIIPAEPEDEAEPDAPERPTPRRMRPGGRLSVERRSEQGALSLERDGGRLRLRSERLAVDPDD
jgi:hypothetical protein